jgi:hypothetical protein
MDVFQCVAEKFDTAGLLALGLHNAYRRDRTHDRRAADHPLPLVVDGLTCGTRSFHLAGARSVQSVYGSLR